MEELDETAIDAPLGNQTADLELPGPGNLQVKHLVAEPTLRPHGERSGREDSPPVLVLDQGPNRVWLVARGIEAADDRAHAGSDDEPRVVAFALQTDEGAGMREAARTAPREDQRLLRLGIGGEDRQDSDHPESSDRPATRWEKPSE